ncbi:MAG: hypothetical protein RL011_1820 [Pseudomonadota bacterium]|jgi:cytochrome c-type biogenesis protein CcmH/NrfG
MRLKSLLASIWTASLTILFGCQTTDPGVSNVDKNRGEVSLYSTSDGRTTLDLKRYKERPRAMAEALKKHLRDNPGDYSAMAALASVETALGELEAAEDHARDVLRHDQKNKSARKTLAEIAMRRNNPDMAALLLNDLGGAQSKDSSVLNMMAMIELKRSNNADAMTLFKKALRLNSDDLAARMNLGVLLLKYRQMDQAAIEFERVLKSVPNHSDAKLHLAIIQSARGQREPAEKMFRQVLAMDDQNPIALYNLAVLLKDDGRYNEAVSYLKAYLRSTRGKANDNEQVLTLIDSIQHHQTARGEKFSDDDIESMAGSDKNANPDTKPEKVATKDQEEPSVDTRPKETKGASDDDDISSLEKTLQ